MLLCKVNFGKYPFFYHEHHKPYELIIFMLLLSFVLVRGVRGKILLKLRIVEEFADNTET